LYAPAAEGSGTVAGTPSSRAGPAPSPPPPVVHGVRVSSAEALRPRHGAPSRRSRRGRRRRPCPGRTPASPTSPATTPRASRRPARRATVTERCDRRSRPHGRPVAEVRADVLATSDAPACPPRGARRPPPPAPPFPSSRQPVPAGDAGDALGGDRSRRRSGGPAAGAWRRPGWRPTTGPPSAAGGTTASQP
jgi:hypothetical protein